MVRTVGPHVARYLRFLALAAGAAFAVAAVGYLPTQNLAGEGGVTAMAVGLALCWAASAFGGVPVLLAEAAQAESEASGQPSEPRLPVIVALGSMLIRLIVVLGFALAAALSGLLAVKPLLLWTALGYLALLGVDTWYVLATARPGQGSSTAQDEAVANEAAVNEAAQTAPNTNDEDAT